MSIWVILAILAFAIAALIAFTTLSGISVIGLVCVGLTALSIHLSGIGPGRWGGPHG